MLILVSIITTYVRRLSTKTSNLFLFNLEPRKSDRGDLKDRNFESDRQPEIAMRRQNRKYLCLLKYDRYHQNFNSKPKVFDATSSKRVYLGDSNNDIDRQPEMAAETGNNYISETMTDSVDIPTACSGFSTMPS